MESMVNHGYPWAAAPPGEKGGKKSFKKVEKILKKTMESVSSSEHHMFTIPLDVNINSGNNWDEAH